MRRAYVFQDPAPAVPVQEVVEDEQLDEPADTSHGAHDAVREEQNDD